MIHSVMIDKVLAFVRDAHEGAVDRAGKPYVLHPIAVAESMDDEASTILALLHDVVEDTEYTYEDILSLGVSEEIVDSLKLLTHIEGEDYFSYIAKIKSNPLATKVKIGDLYHNMDLTRLPIVGDEDLRRVEKYRQAMSILKS